MGDTTDEVVAEIHETIGLLEELPRKIRHHVMVPLDPGGLVVVPGYLDRTNEVFVSLGDEAVVHVSASHAVGILDRRLASMGMPRTPANPVHPAPVQVQAHASAPGEEAPAAAAAAAAAAASGASGASEDGEASSEKLLEALGLTKEMAEAHLAAQNPDKPVVLDRGGGMFEIREPLGFDGSAEDAGAGASSADAASVGAGAHEGPADAVEANMSPEYLAWRAQLEEMAAMEEAAMEEGVDLGVGIGPVSHVPVVGSGASSSGSGKGKDEAEGEDAAVVGGKGAGAAIVMADDVGAASPMLDAKVVEKDPYDLVAQGVVPIKESPGESPIVASTVVERNYPQLGPEGAEALANHIEIEAAKDTILRQMHASMLAERKIIEDAEDEGNGEMIDTRGMSAFRIEMLRRQGKLP